MWLASRVSLRASTLSGYAAHVEEYLDPHLGGVPLRELSIGDVQRMFASIMRCGASGRPVTPATLHRIHATLRAALNAAVRARHVDDNPARYVELPQARRPHAVVWTPTQIAEWQRSGVRPAAAITNGGVATAANISVTAMSCWRKPRGWRLPP
jgi:hypothetical protein